MKREFYDIIDELGFENLNPILVIQKALTSKAELNDLLAEIEAQHKTKITTPSDKTIEMYVRNIELIMHGLHTTQHDFYKNIKKVLAYLDEREFKLETKKNYIKSIIYILKESADDQFIDLYRAEYDKINTAVIELASHQEKSESNTKGWMTFVEQKKISKDLSHTLSTDYIITLFYSGLFFAPWRLQELYELKIRNFIPNEGNYIDFENNQIVLNIYKTSTKYGMVRQHMSPELRSILSQWAEMNPHDWCIVSTKGEKFYQQALHRKLTFIYGTSVDTLRSIYATDMWTKGKLNSKAQHQKLAIEMRHSVSMNTSYIKVAEHGDHLIASVEDDEDNEKA